MAAKSRSHNKQNQVRIIGGQWRGRKLAFPSSAGLRPTPDRVRETLYNWLQPYLPGMTCLDLFAGSGVLGFEALSRGARSVTFVEFERNVSRVLQDNINLLGAGDKAHLRCMDALAFIQESHDSLYDLIFLDPPYAKGLAVDCLRSVERHPCLKPGGLVYLEHERSLEMPDLSDKWQVLKNKMAGQVSYSLLRSI